MFNGKEGSFITESEGAGMVNAYRNSYPGNIKGVFLGRNKLEDLLNQSGAMGIRFYFAENASGDMRIVCVAADSDEDDIIGLVLQHGTPCPTCCSSTGSLR